MSQAEYYQKAYFEQPLVWKPDRFIDPGERERISETVGSIPDDAHSILDAGCGNGTFVNGLFDSHRCRFNTIVGLDASYEALRHVKTCKVYAHLFRMPFNSKSFDLVTCLEVLEHLPQIDFEHAAAELQRISRKYILITVPNNENLVKSLVLCPRCRCAFNPCLHVRSFNKDNIAGLFHDFNLIVSKEIGPIDATYTYPDLLYFLRLGYQKYGPPPASLCPQCGYQQQDNANILNNHTRAQNIRTGMLTSVIRKIIGRRINTRRWLLALYIRAAPGAA